MNTQNRVNKMMFRKTELSSVKVELNLINSFEDEFTNANKLMTKAYQSVFKIETAIQDMLNACLMIIAVDTNDNAFVLGVSEKYRNESVAERSQTFGQFASAEGGSGAAYSDENGVTISLMARQFEMPREYVPSATGITVASTGLTATTD